MQEGSCASDKRIGIFGGTFDPVHLGHIRFAEMAMEEAGLDEIVFMPAYIQPFKQERYVANGSDRFRMLELTTKHEERFKVSSWELEQEKVSYTYDTICHLMNDENYKDIFFLLGSDSMMKLERWKHGEEILRLCNFVIGVRPTDNQKDIEEHAKRLSDIYGTKIVLLDKTMLPISSTIIRENVSEGKPITGLVSPLVEEYIYTNELYI